MALVDFPWLNLNNVTWDVAQCHARHLQHLSNPSVKDCKDEGGIDISVPSGTPITALADGVLVGRGPCLFAAGGSCGGDVVTTRSNIPGLGQSDLYYQHIRLAPGLKNCSFGKCSGQRVKRGQVIGYSTGLVEVGINPPGWFGVWGSSPHPGKWQQDPRPFLRQLSNQVNTSPGGVPPGPTVANVSVGTPNTTLAQAGAFFTGIGQKIMLLLVALTLVGVGAYLTFTKQVNGLVKGVTHGV